MNKNFRAEMQALCVEYGEELHKDVVNARALTAIETKLKDLKSEARKDAEDVVIGNALKHTNPVLEAARNMRITYPSFKFVRTEGVVTGLEVIDAYDEVRVTAVWKKMEPYIGLKTCGFDKTGLAEYRTGAFSRAYKLAFLIAQKKAGGLDISAEKIAELEKDFKLTAEAKKETFDKDPFSNRQMTKTLQSVVDRMAFVPNENGENSLKVTTADFKYVWEVMGGNSRETGHIKAKKGANLAQYIFGVIHMLATGEAYSIGTGNLSKGDRDIVRKPIPVSPLIGEKAEKPDVKTVTEEVVELERPAAEPATEEAVA